MLHWPVQAGKRITVWLINRSALYLIAPSNARTYASVRSYKFINNLHWKRHLPSFFACLLFICYLISVYSAISECKRFYQLYDTAAKYSIDMCNTANMTDLSRDKAKVWNSKRGTGRASLAYYANFFFSRLHLRMWSQHVTSTWHFGYWLINPWWIPIRTVVCVGCVCCSYEDQRKRI